MSQNLIKWKPEIYKANPICEFVRTVAIYTCQWHTYYIDMKKIRFLVGIGCEKRIGFGDHIAI